MLLLSGIPPGLGDKIYRMRYTTTISAETLSAHLGDPAWAILDCRFSLADPSAGRLAYHAAHIPGAVYVHLDDDLCAPVIPGKTGRHPLPPVEQLVENFSRWGIDRQTQVVVYDDHPGGSGAIAARCWWSLRYLGHAAVAVLDGGWQRWQAAGLPVQGGGEVRSRRQFIAQLQPAMLATVDEVQAARRDPASASSTCAALTATAARTRPSTRLPGTSPARFRLHLLKISAGMGFS